MPISKVLGAAAAAISAIALLPIASAQLALPEEVETTQLATDPFSIGALGAGERPLQDTLWTNSAPQTLDFLLSHAPARPASPSLGQAMRRTLLSPGVKPAGADASLGGKKLMALARAGFINEAQTIASLATTGKNDPFVGEAEATIALLNNDSEGACRRSAGLTAGRDSIFWVKLRAFCYARAGELDAFDLTMNLLRERGALAPSDEALFVAIATGAPAKTVPPIESPLQYAALKESELEVNPALLAQADGGVLAALAQDTEASPALRIEAAEQAIALGVLQPGMLKGIFANVEFEVAEIASALDTAAARPFDPLVDALLYQSIVAMTAPEFIRDKAQRISLALERADSFHRAYSLSHLYADEIASLEGVLVSPEEASDFALASMAVGDSVGAGRWLSAMIGTNESVGALPQDLGGAFIDNVNLLAVLDPQTAARIARNAGVSLLDDSRTVAASVPSHEDPAVMARILEAAFDAVAEDKAGQAGLAALAASSGAGANSGEVESVIIGQGLNAAGMPELHRRHRFERAWAATFTANAAPANVAEETAPIEEAASSNAEDGPTPRLKPNRGQ